MTATFISSLNAPLPSFPPLNLPSFTFPSSPPTPPLTLCNLSQSGLTHRNRAAPILSKADLHNVYGPQREKNNKSAFNTSQLTRRNDCGVAIVTSPRVTLSNQTDLKGRLIIRSIPI